MVPTVAGAVHCLATADERLDCSLLACLEIIDNIVCNETNLSRFRQLHWGFDSRLPLHLCPITRTNCIIIIIMIIIIVLIIKDDSDAFKLASKLFSETSNSICILISSLPVLSCALSAKFQFQSRKINQFLISCRCCGREHRLNECVCLSVCACLFV